MGELGRRSFCSRMLSALARAGASAPRTAPIHQQVRLLVTIGPDASRRTGLLAIKCGMTSQWDSWGVQHPLTVLKVDGCQVVQAKTSEKEGYNALQIGMSDKKMKRCRQPEISHFRKHGVEPKKPLQEFRVTEDA